MLLRLALASVIAAMFAAGCSKPEEGTAPGSQAPAANGRTPAAGAAEGQAPAAAPANSNDVGK